jgi:transcriptional regulator with GAF, ATPase, and Fis domain
MAHLMVLTGLLAGRMSSIDGETFSIGRLPANDLELPELSISRHHCVIERETVNAEAVYRIRDLQSANGVKVNGQAVTECQLRPGDRIQLGDCLLRFQEEEPRMIVSEAADIESTFRIGPAEMRDIQAGIASGGMPETGRYADDLRALLEISVALSDLRHVGEIQTKFLERIVARIPADYAAAIPIISTDLEGSMRRASQHARNEKSLAQGISRTVLDRVLQTHEAILAGGVRNEFVPSTSDSFVRSGARAVLAAPALVHGEVAGVIYLASAAAGSFDTHHLRLAAAAGSILGPAVRRAVALEDLERENARLLSQVRIGHQIVGASPGIAKVLTDIQRICASDATVLILGETGTGKELAAQAIHANSSRSSRPMIAVNCAAFTEGLMESELFGHERGAFSGAIALKRGIFEQAQGGTLFLDEIGELPLALQAKLLRVLESHEIRRVGGEKAIPVNFRLVAATHRDLREAVRTATFRADLFYRLDVVSVRIPPLRERRQDILPLAEHFLAEFRRKTSRQIEDLAASTRAYLERYEWPGNVRELRNAIERAVIAGASPFIEIEDLPDALTDAQEPESETAPYKQALLDAKRKIVLAAYKAADGNHSRAAELLGVHPNNLHRMLNELGIREQARKAIS